MFRKKKITCVVPARGGSKGIKNKNLIDFYGMPLIFWVLDAAKKSKLIDSLFVSTDNFKIKQYVNSLNVNVIDRPKNLARDNSSSDSVLVHALKQIKKKNLSFDIIVFLQCTSPLISENEIDKGIKFLFSENLDSTFAATIFDGFLWHNTTENYKGINHDESDRLMRQELETQVLEAGSIYIMRSKIFMKEKYRFCGNFKPFVISKNLVSDINDNEDLIRTEVLKEKLEKKKINSFFFPSALIMDFDGVHTNNKFILNQKGIEKVECDRSDGLGLEILRKKFSNIRLLIITNEKNKVVKERCRKLKIELIQTDNKINILKTWLKDNAIKMSKIFYVGNDINDLDCLKAAGLSFCPSDACFEVKKSVGYILNKNGGNGAIREIVDLILENYG